MNRATLNALQTKANQLKNSMTTREVIVFVCSAINVSFALAIVIWLFT